MESILQKKQVKTFTKHLPDMVIVAECRHDDDCGDGHNTFAITASVYEPHPQRGEPTIRHTDGRVMWLNACGCQHDLIAEHFPELRHLIKWHLCSTDGPMHYLGNALYLAGDRDCHGHRKGEPSAWSHAVQFGDNPIRHKISKSFSVFLQECGPEFDLEVLRIEYGPDKSGYKFAPKYTFGGFADRWHECPFDTEPEALDFLHALKNCSPRFLQIPTAWSDGKERELDAARRAAVWPEATDAELCAEPEVLKAALIARLPALLEEFQRDMEGLGFTW